jgi:ribosomal protein L11 methylase PrmA
MSPTEARVEPGSFRDRDSRVVVGDDGVYRVLSERGAEDWRALSSSPLLERLTADGSLIATEEVQGPFGAAHGTGLLAEPVAATLRHERIPFVSYPYEWTFGMLRDAALLELDLELQALEEGLTLKDATPYNVQFRGSAPVFIDVGSFERLREGEPWAGYRQFCMLYLYPLLLQAYRDVPFQPWLRGSIDGITPEEAANLFSLRDRFRRGVLTHVALHARLERRYGKREGGEVKEEMKRANFKPELIKSNVSRLRKLIGRLRWRAGDTAWTGYRRENTYTDQDAEQKAAFVREAVAAKSPGLVWDLGCNDGAYSRIAAEQGGSVVAIDSDHATVEALYRSLRSEDDAASCHSSATSPTPRPGSAGAASSGGPWKSAALPTSPSPSRSFTMSRSPQTSRSPSSSTGCGRSTQRS